MDLLARFDTREDGSIDNIRLIIAGPAQRFSTLPTRQDTAFLGLRFRAGWGGVCLGIDPATIRDAVLLGDAALQVLGVLAEPLLRARDLIQLETALAGVAASMIERAPASIAQRRSLGAIELLQQSGGRLPVAELAAAVASSERTLRRDILHSVGLSVKTLASVMRFQRTLQLLHAVSPQSLTQIALEGGYSDQAHMTREFRLLGGFTPALRPAVALINWSG